MRNGTKSTSGHLFPRPPLFRARVGRALLFVWEESATVDVLYRACFVFIFGWRLSCSSATSPRLREVESDISWCALKRTKGWSIGIIVRRRGARRSVRSTGTRGTPKIIITSAKMRRRREGALAFSFAFQPRRREYCLNDDDDDSKGLGGTNEIPLRENHHHHHRVSSFFFF